MYIQLNMNKKDNKSFSLSEILTVNKGAEYHPDSNRIFLRKTFHRQSLQPSTTPNLQPEPEVHKEGSLKNFQNKLLNYLKSNQTHAKAATNYMERIGRKESGLLLKVKKKSTSMTKDPLGLSQKQKKRRSMKQYLAELSLEKRKMNDHKSSGNSMDVTPRSREDQKKSYSVLIIRKINKKKSTLNYEYELERSATRESKAPIHNTQAYFFQRHKMKTEEAILEDPGESMTLSLGNTKSIKKQDENIINLKYSDINKYHSIINQSHSREDKLPIYFSDHNDHNFIKRRKKLFTKLSKNVKVHPLSKIKTEEETQEVDIGPWQRRITVDSQLP